MAGIHRPRCGITGLVGRTAGFNGSAGDVIPGAINKRALQEWEKGGRQPDSAARAYPTVIAMEPQIVRRALARD